MKEELEKLEQTMDEITNCNLNDATKKFVLEELKSRLFDLSREINQVKKNEDFVKNGFGK